MSSSMRVLLVALVGLAAIGGVTLLVERDPGTSAVPAAAPTTAAPATSTTAAPETTTTVSATSTTVSATSTTTTTPPPSAPCPTSQHGAVIDRETQQAWLCEEGLQTVVFPITSAISLPDPGRFAVYAKDMNATSTFGGHFSRMTHFVAFTRGENTGARVAFHSVPTLTNGDYVQPLDSVGDLDRRGESAGCIRVLPSDADLVWDWLSIGDEVWVIS